MFIMLLSIETRYLDLRNFGKFMVICQICQRFHLLKFPSIWYIFHPTIQYKLNNSQMSIISMGHSPCSLVLLLSSTKRVPSMVCPNISTGSSATVHPNIIITKSRYCNLPSRTYTVYIRRTY